MVATMELYPDKYWILWNIPPVVEDDAGGETYALDHANFNDWMVNTLQAGLDSYGAFPTNVYIFDVFTLLKDPSSNFMNPAYADGSEDSHPNALASSLVAPILVQQMFDAARAYEENLLPVELTSFSATIIGSTIKLSWNTATEINNFGFDVERTSTSPTQEWTKIGFVEGHGTSNSPKYYSFEDNNLTARKYIYRLKQIDSDGQFEYSKEIEVDLDATIKYELSQNYPNPFNPTTTIHFSLPTSGNVKLTLYNTTGQEVRNLLNEYKESGTHIINFNASGLSSGAYIYKLTAGTFSTTRKMIVIK
ncbi:MAG: T9SS type A sorting domain-containing protein [Ignavibacteriales bacterium]|nr:T9SS type A sorting domain-containing protein [Ignavibacteriales bacterium]